MKLVDQWGAVEAGLPEGWHAVRLHVRPEDPADVGEAARILGPMTVGHLGDTLVLTVTRAGGAAGPQAARRLFGYLDDARIWSVLQADDATTAPAAGPATVGVAPEPAPEPLRLADTWDAALQTLPGDWSDLLCELEVDSSDHLDRAALLCAPTNPTRDGDRLAFTFRCARRAGYGVTPGMARRCFERCDEEGLVGWIAVLRVLSDTDPVGTQGPTWLVGGKVL